ncbi:hypothetical protein H0W80_03640 [Candidatus Saccharibacteria bacterium]|nr:hypothetical protein [Candidatus Saccharibacteria bacterium]
MKKIKHNVTKKSYSKLKKTHRANTINNQLMKKDTTKVNTKLILLICAEVCIALTIFGWLKWQDYILNHSPVIITAINQVEKTQPPSVQTGKILNAEALQSYSPTQTTELIKQTNKNFDLPVTSGISKQVIRYTSSDGHSNDVPIYARVYMPLSPNKQLPVLAFAPGTTGLGDGCAASIEQPQKRNWANYDSLMAAYASQGYIVIITDYEGMRDPARIHHYMVGDVEGRAVLDSLRAIKNLDSTKKSVDQNAFFTGGYSQGGHAAYWADAIASKYAPEIKLKGAIGFGPVTSVNETLTDAITNNANINWFGPFVVVSYQDWYKHTFPVDKILVPQFTKNLRSDVLRECIDTATHFWPSNIGANKSAEVYTAEFIAAAKSGNIANNSAYTQFANDMSANIVGTVKTLTPKLINQGQYDNVVLSRQSKAGYQRMCASGNSTNFKEYSTNPYAIQGYNPKGLVDHYQTMNASFKDTLGWMEARMADIPLVDSCL